MFKTYWKLRRRNELRIRDTTNLGPTDGPGSIWGPIKPSENHVLGSFRCFFSVSGGFSNMGSHWGRLRTIFDDLLFADVR